MGQRLDLHNLLKTILGSDNVYFQPPPNYKMSYPCIVYNRSNIRSEHADNYPYKHRKEYTVTVIDKDPDSLIPDEIAMLSGCIHDRNYRSDNLNHDVFTLLY